MATITGDRKILVAIDFGTTYSAIAWTQTLKPEIQEVATLWPTPFSQTNEGQNSDKVPTELRYEESGLKWGFQILESQPRHQLFKLELDDTKRYKPTTLSQSLPDPRGLPPGYDMTGERLISDYLEALRKHTEQILRNKIPAPALASTPVEYIVTVPAVWSDSAKAKTKAAAKRAGMGRVHLVAEPEAGAVYALHALHPHTIKVGDAFMAVDAGGGTVDVITYKVEELEPVLKISEVTSGAGALCGSSFLNHRFQEDLRNKFSSDRFWEDDILDEAMERFERVIKRNFTGAGTEEFNVPVVGLRDDERRGVRRGRLRVTGDEVATLFKPVVEEVLALVKKQMHATEQPLSAILLMGGFGQSHYLRSQIQAAVGNVRVMQSPQSWTAVVRGALILGLASTLPDGAGVRISARKARKHYGIPLYKTFDPAIDDANCKYWSPYNDCYVVDYIDWFIKKNETVQEQKPHLKKYFKTYATSEGRPLTEKITIYSCSDTDNRGAPTREDGEHLQRLVNVETS